MTERNIFFSYYEDLSRKKQKKVRDKFKEKELSWTSFLQKHSYKKLDRLTIYLIVGYFDIFKVPIEDRQEIMSETGLI